MTGEFLGGYFKELTASNQEAVVKMQQTVDKLNDVYNATMNTAPDVVFKSSDVLKETILLSKSLYSNSTDVKAYTLQLKSRGTMKLKVKGSQANFNDGNITMKLYKNGTVIKNWYTSSLVEFDFKSTDIIDIYFNVSNRTVNFDGVELYYTIQEKPADIV